MLIFNAGIGSMTLYAATYTYTLGRTRSAGAFYLVRLSNTHFSYLFNHLTFNIVVGSHGLSEDGPVFDPPYCACNPYPSHVGCHFLEWPSDVRRLLFELGEGRSYVFGG